MEATTHTEDWILTASGRQFWPLEPEAGEIDIEDIATALCHQARYNGHARGGYSVAQHSVHLSDWFAARDQAELARYALLHDAAEAYLGDIVRPLKGGMTGYLAAEARLERAILARFGLGGAIPEAVREADTRIITDEFRYLFPSWAVQAHGLDRRSRLGIAIPSMPVPAVRELFLRRFKALFGGAAA